MNSKYDKLIYINLTQDQATTTASELIIKDVVAELVKIPDGSDLKTLDDSSLFPQCSNRSKIYFSAHGREEVDGFVFDRRTVEANIYPLEDVAFYLGKLLIDSQFKDPSIRPRLTLVMSVCEGVGFAKKLQKRLMQEHGIYIDVIANKYVLHEQYQRDPSTQQLIISHKETSEKGEGRIHQRPHSKVLLTIDATGEQSEVDAYELKWIDKVSQSLHEQVVTFSRWADFSKPENIEILKSITTLSHDVDIVISSSIEKGVGLTANCLFSFLLSCQKTSMDPLYVDAMKYEMMQIIVKNLINEGIKYINPEQAMKDYIKNQKQIEYESQKAISNEVRTNLVLAKKAIYSELLAEASEHGIDSVLSQIEKVQEEIDELRKPFGV